MFTSFFVRSILVATCVFCGQNNAGIYAETVVQTQNGATPLKFLKIGDKIFCANMQSLSLEEREISAIEEVQTQNVIEITTSDKVTFYVAADQKLFVTHKWVEAQQLTLEDVLLTKDRTLVKVVSVRNLQLDNPITLRFITVDEHHNFFAAENGVLIHNAIGGAFLGCWAGQFAVQAVWHGSIHGIAVLTGPAYPVVVGTLYFYTAAPAAAATYAAGIAGGIAGGVASGPL